VDEPRSTLGPLLGQPFICRTVQSRVNCHAPPKAYRTTWGEVISGLDRQSDGRWRIIESGYRFTEANESRAIQKFRQLTSATKPVVTLTIPVTKPDMAPEDILDGWNKPLPESHFLAINPSSIAVTLDADERTVDRTADFNIDEKSVLNWVRKQLIENPAEFARKIGIEQIAYLTDLKKPTDITIEDLISNYEKRQRDKSSTVATLRTFRKFVDDTKIKSIQEMTTERLLTFRDKIEKSNFGTGYKKFIYSRIRDTAQDIKSSYTAESKWWLRQTANSAWMPN
jgi:hypothetical protein